VTVTDAPTTASTQRERLGIPAAAERVLVLAESTHWDPNWLLTSEEYYRLRVRRTLDAVVGELEAEPRRVWSAECAWFVRLWAERRPGMLDRLRPLVADGRFRFTGSGVTTPDTLLPDDA